MENNLRKHVLSSYATVNAIEFIINEKLDTISTEISNQDEFSTNVNGPTRITENVESSDADELMMLGSTRITKSVEASDPDGFLLGKSTGLTHAIEDSDPDEFRLSGCTIYETNIIETSDPDEFRVKGITLERRVIEIKDPNDMHMEPTKHTFTVETSDEDELLLM